MPTLPIFQTDNKPMSLLQTSWKAILAPFLRNPALQGQILPNVALSVGSNSVNHRLGRPLLGWCLVRQRSLAAVYDTQDANSEPALTLLLVADAATIVDIYVF